MISGQCMTQATEATSKINCPKPFLTPYLEIPDDIGSRHQQRSTTKLCHANFHTDRREISVLSQKVGLHIVLIGDFPGSYRIMLYILESSRRADFEL